ncbi:MAG: hypothetical protein GY723_16955 [bacterium]|nr:hypothetical protein [bacterium]MCP5069332.1 hypothetical protein [bacterium]
MTAATRTLTRCLLCGFTEVHTDQVIDRGIVLLSECPRCDHRWTERGVAAPLRMGSPLPARSDRVAAVEAA